MIKKHRRVADRPTSEVQPTTVALTTASVVFLSLALVLSSFTAGYTIAKNSGNNGAVQVAAGPTTAPPQQPDQPQVNYDQMPAVSDKDHIKGNKNAEVVMVEYSDYECPFCKQVHPSLQQVMKEYGNKVAWVFRHYPLPFHPKAQKTAEAAECAAELGGGEAFWKMTDAMYEKMPTLELSQLGDVAKSIGVDKGKFQSCLDSGKYASKVSDDLNGGSKAGIQGTPGIILVGKNGKKEFVPGALPFEQIKPLIEKVLNG